MKKGNFRTEKCNNLKNKKKHLFSAADPIAVEPFVEKVLLNLCQKLSSFICKSLFLSSVSLCLYPSANINIVFMAVGI